MAFLPPYQCKTNSKHNRGEQIYGPKVLFYYQLKNNPKLCIQKATLIHAWGPVMTISMGKANVDMDTSAAKRD
jgi:hypothetical protein